MKVPLSATVILSSANQHEAWLSLPARLKLEPLLKISSNDLCLEFRYSKSGSGLLDHYKNSVMRVLSPIAAIFYHILRFQRHPGPNVAGCQFWPCNCHERGC